MVDKNTEKEIPMLVVVSLIAGVVVDRFFTTWYERLWRRLKKRFAQR